MREGGKVMVKPMTLKLISTQTSDCKLIPELTRHVVTALPSERPDTVHVPITGRKKPGF